MMPLNDKQQAQFTMVCARIADGMSLRGICSAEREKDPKAFPAAPTILDWTGADPILAERYARAVQLRGEHHGELVLTTAMDESIDPSSRKIMVDALKWTAAKLFPTVYGDKLALGGADDLPAIRQEVQEAADTFTRSLAGMVARDKAGKGETRH